MTISGYGVTAEVLHQIEEHAGEALTDVTTSLGKVGDEVRNVVLRLLEEHQDLFSGRIIQITYFTANPGVSGYPIWEVELVVATCQLVITRRQYEQVEDFEPGNIWSLEPPTVVRLSEPIVGETKQLPLTSWVEHRFAILKKLLLEVQTQGNPSE